MVTDNKRATNPYNPFVVELTEEEEIGVICMWY
jgi:hypothetical protein